MYFTTKEQLRIDVITKYLNGQIIREHARTVLELGERQFTRLIKRFKENGLYSIKHGNIGRTPKNKIDQLLEEKIVQLSKNKYSGFNITHFHEKLADEFSNIPSYSTVRRILTEHKLNRPRPRRAKGSHKSRNRYSKEGIMVQIDGSHHAWFGRQNSCLIGAIDDATGKIVGAKFSKTETSLDTMVVVEQVLKKYGRFHILYSDKAGIYDNKKREGFTNVTRALSQLDITSVLANSPQAKGRVERLWGTLQDRLVSEMRIRNIFNIEDANNYLEEFIEYYNKKFAVLPSNCESAYRPLPADVDLNDVFCMIEERMVQTGNRICIDNQKLVITTNLGYSLRNKIVEIKTYRDGIRKFFVDMKEVQVTPLLDVKRAS